MTSDQYNEVMEEAQRRYVEYQELFKDSNFKSVIIRKEDLPEYWIAAVAFEKGKNNT